jgi:hypothetical protein
MKLIKVAGVVVAQFICLITFISMNYIFGFYFMVSMFALCLLIPIILLLLQNISPQVKAESKYILVGTIATIIILISALYWLEHSFTR